jgi:hypothetical protein
MGLLTRGFSNRVRGARHCVKPRGERTPLFSEMLRATRFLAITGAPDSLG